MCLAYATFQCIAQLAGRLSDRTFNESLVNPLDESTSDVPPADFWSEWWEPGPHPRDAFRNFVKVYLLDLLCK